MRYNVHNMAGSSLTITDLDSGRKAQKKPVSKPAAKVVTEKTTKKTKAVSVVKKDIVKAPVAATPKKAPVKKTVRKKTKTAQKTKNSKQTKAAETPITLSYPPKYVLKRDAVEKAERVPKTKDASLIPHLKREPLGHLLVESLLREAGFAGGVSTDKAILDKYTHDESIFAVRPQIVLQPKNQRDVEIAVRVLGEQTKRFPSLSLTPRAAGTGLSGGSLTDSVVIDVVKYMRHIEEPHTIKDATTITCQPGAMWKGVEKILKRKGVYLPSYPASKDICSIGGSIANNAAGPDSLRFGHCADWVESMNVTLYDGHTYTLAPLTYKQYKALIAKDNAYATIAKAVFTLIEKNEKLIQEGKPKTSKNSAGYALWNVLSGSVASFKRGKATFDLGRLVSGSQGTLGIITSVTLQTEPIAKNTELIAIPLFDLLDAGKVITKALDYNPINIEIFDGLTFDLALSNPHFFKDRLGKISYYKVLLSMYTLYHVRYARKTPDFTVLITLDEKTIKNRKIGNIVKVIRAHRGRYARHITSPVEREMFWQVRRASYSLSKFQDVNKRPAAFLEDMTVPPENLSRFFVEIKKLLKKYNVTAAVHGHGGNGHLHFYPLLDFTQKSTPQLVEKMAEEFFATAIKFDGNLCGEHNDGIIRTPHLSKMFNPKILSLFKQVENIFDPQDIFNPGKKVNPRFDIKETIRKTN